MSVSEAALTYDSAPPTKFLRRVDAARYIRETYGVRCAPGTLETRGSLGTGPKFQRFNGQPVYESADLDAWVLASLRPSRADCR